MPTIYNKFMAKYAPYSLLLIVLDCTGCKNQAASKNSGPRPNKSQDQHSVRNDSNIEQKNDATGCEGSDIHPKDGVTQVAQTDLDVKTNGESSQKDETKTQPNFNLKNITVAAGNQSFLMLEASGNTAGYTIKSIAIKQNDCYYTTKFGIDSFKNQVIPAGGLPISLTVDPIVKAGSYLLRIKLGTLGKGSKKTEQWLESIIYVTDNEIKVINRLPAQLLTTPRSGHTLVVQQNQTLNDKFNLRTNESLNQSLNQSLNESVNESLNESFNLADLDTNAPNFTLNDVTIEAGLPQATMLEAVGNTEGYIIKSIAIKQNDRYYTTNFGLDGFKNHAIPPIGLPITLTTDTTVKAGSYVLKIKLGQIGKGSKKTEQWVSAIISVINHKNQGKHRSSGSKPTTPKLDRTILADDAITDQPIDKDKLDIDKNPINHLITQNTQLEQNRLSLKDITLEIGTLQSTMLEISGNRAGYEIKSIAVEKNHQDYTGQFGIHTLDHNPITANELPIRFEPASKLQPGIYILKIGLSRTGKSSKRAEVFLKSMLYLIPDKEYITNHPSNTKQIEQEKNEALFYLVLDSNKLIFFLKNIYIIIDYQYF